MFEQPLGKEGAVVRVCESVGTLATAELVSKGRNGGEMREGGGDGVNQRKAKS